MSKVKIIKLPKFEAKENKDGKWDVRITNPRTAKGGFRRIDENSREDVPVRNVPYEDNARLIAAHLTQYGNRLFTGKWDENK